MRTTIRLVVIGLVAVLVLGIYSCGGGTDTIGDGGPSDGNTDANTGPDGGDQYPSVCLDTDAGNQCPSTAPSCAEPGPVGVGTCSAFLFPASTDCEPGAAQGHESCQKLYASPGCVEFRSGSMCQAFNQEFNNGIIINKLTFHPDPPGYCNGSVGLDNTPRGAENGGEPDVTLVVDVKQRLERGVVVENVPVDVWVYAAGSYEYGIRMDGGLQTKREGTIFREDATSAKVAVSRCSDDSVLIHLNTDFRGLLTDSFR